MQDYTKTTLGELLSSENETIKRNAISILKTLQNKKEIYKNFNGYYIIEGIGNIIYLPEKIDDMVDFIKDYFI